MMPMAYAELLPGWRDIRNSPDGRTIMATRVRDDTGWGTWMLVLLVLVLLILLAWGFTL
jgi:hypothetical protein